MPRLCHLFPCIRSSGLLAVVLALAAPLVFAAKLPIDDGIYRALHPALGISDEFGRWNKPIKLVYDPDDAPAAYSDNARVLDLLREAYGYWTLVSGVQFELIGVDTQALDDRNSHPSERDGIVRVSWDAIGSGVAGQAGPTGGFFDQDLGYFPYDDGTVELNNGADVIDSDIDLIGVLVHELGHLLGLGHSDNPDSVMYANPYNHLRHPRADDIRAIQVMYGAPAVAIDARAPIPDWIFTAPPQASATTTQFLFKANSQIDAGTRFTIGDTPVSGVANSADNAEVVILEIGLGASPAHINVDASLYLVDPAGYLYSKKAWPLECPANFSCTASIGVANLGAIKTIPGTWRIHVVNDATGQTLVSLPLPVTTTTSFNQAPAATVTAAPGNGPGQARFTVNATDPEGGAIDVIWHPPGLIGTNVDVRNRIASGGSASLDVDFAQSGTHTFFVELRDDGARYGDGPDASPAGDGFQTLLRITATLPEATLQVVSTADAGTAPGNTVSQQVLAAVARTPSPLLVANTGGNNAVSSAGVALSYGASRDQGATTQTIFQSGDKVVIAGGVSPLAADVGKAADVFVVVRTTVGGVDTWTYRNTSGVFVPWPSVSIGLLQPAYNVASLLPSQSFEIHNGNLIAAQHRVYVGYRLSGGTTLFYTGQAHTLSVAN